MIKYRSFFNSIHGPSLLAKEVQMSTEAIRVMITVKLQSLQRDERLKKLY